MPVAEYLKYWLNHISDTGRIERRDWSRFWQNLLNEKIAVPEDREEFDRYFTNSGRGSATPRPGLRCTFGWPLDEAQHLDTRGQLINTIRERLNQLLEALGEDRINP